MFPALIDHTLLVIWGLRILTIAVFYWQCNICSFLLVTRLQLLNSLRPPLSDSRLHTVSIWDWSELEAGHRCTVARPERGLVLSCWNIHWLPGNRCRHDGSTCLTKMPIYTFMSMTPSHICKSSLASSTRLSLENLATFVHRYTLRLPPCVIKFQVAFLDAAVDTQQWFPPLAFMQGDFSRVPECFHNIIYFRWSKT